MADLVKINGHTVIDYMSRDFDSFLKSMHSLVSTKLPEWEDHESEADFGNVLLQAFAHMGDVLSYYQDRIANEGFLGTAQTRRSIIHHLRLIGYRLATAAPASTNLRMTVNPDVNDSITIRKGDAFATKSSKKKSSVRFEYSRDQDLVIDCSALPLDSEGKKYYTGIPVEEGRFISNEVLGTSDGTEHQQFPLAHTELILRSRDQNTIKDITLLVELGMEVEEWTLRESLVFSHEMQHDFIIEIDENEQAVIHFGDNKFGAIPPVGAVIRASYRIGGGQAGNTGPNTIETIVDAPELALIGAAVTNPNAATGGGDREDIDEAVAHAPSVFRTNKRAVTADDYEALALSFQGVGKVRATSTNWNTVNLFVAPEGGGQVSDILRANLIAHFEDKRHMSTIIEINDVDYIPVYVTAEIGVEGYYLPDDIAEKAKKAGAALLDFDAVDFGYILYLSKFYEELEKIPGIAYVNITEFRKEGQADGLVDSSGKIIVKSSEIPVIPDTEKYRYGINVVVKEEE